MHRTSVRRGGRVLSDIFILKMEVAAFLRGRYHTEEKRVRTMFESISYNFILNFQNHDLSRELSELEIISISREVYGLYDPK